MKSKNEIDQEYLSVCAQVGDTVIKQKELELVLAQLSQKVNELKQQAALLTEIEKTVNAKPVGP